MKSTELKKMIKDAVKEAIQEEMKDILLEAVRAPKGSSVAVVQESVNPTANIQSQPTMTAEQKRSLYEQALNETSLSFNSSQAQTFKDIGYDSESNYNDTKEELEKLVSTIGYTLESYNVRLQYGKKKNKID